MRSQPIQVTSHVARDFLQNAAYFNTMPKLIWEYVANSLDAARDGIPIVIDVEMTRNHAIITDNGRGMSRGELNSFFQMHGENTQRKRGRRVRGRFGTGKCAAFGLANCLRIDTSQAGLRNIVELQREDIERAQSGDAFPVHSVVVDQPTDGHEGTVVEIRRFNIKRVSVNSVISYIERHLSRYRQRARVTVNGHECKFKEPPFIERLERFPPTDVAEHVGEVRLVVKLSPVPLNDDLRGIDILAYGIWHGTTLAGIEKREFASYMFGHVDVPILEDGEWPIPAFDNTRNNMLNPQNPVVAELLDWLSDELERIRVYAIERERARQDSEAARQLAKQARRISRILNDDFMQQELELELARRVTRRSGRKSARELLDEPQNLRTGNGPTPREQMEVEPSYGDGAPLWDRWVLELSAGDETTRWGQTVSAFDSETLDNPDGRDDPFVSSPTPPPGPRREVEQRQDPPKKRRPVFHIDFENVTADSPRSRYDSDAKTIVINLDHPQVASALEAGGGDADSREFLGICYEIITVEYALAIPHEKLEKGELDDAGDALFDVRDTINRVGRRFTQVLGS